MKFCKDCKHYRTQFNEPVCTHPDNPGAVDLVSGRQIFQQALCGAIRQDIRRCGPSAQWFDPANLDAKLAMLEENTATVYIATYGGKADPKAFRYRSAAEKSGPDDIMPVEYWDKQ